MHVRFSSQEFFNSIRPEAAVELITLRQAADDPDIGDRLAICHPATILRSLATSTKPNPFKDGDGKLRILASSEKPWKTPRRTQDRRAVED